MNLFIIFHIFAKIINVLGTNELHPGLSVDCVIFGFHDNQLKVLLLKFKNLDRWALPGGFVGKEEDVDAAATHVLKDRTGLDDIFLTQFYLFGDGDRGDAKFDDEIIEADLISKEDAEWFKQRFITIGYYSLVDYSRAVPVPDDISESCEWFSLDELPNLIFDHKEIISKALWTLRTQLKYYPIGENLLPDKFTMPELQVLYETLLGKKLDRRNFQRKMIGYDILIRHNETRKGGAHKAPYLYSFDKKKYKSALEDGLYSIW
jgi:8-oxo-dGTP diphosphatase